MASESKVRTKTLGGGRGSWGGKKKEASGKIFLLVSQRQRWPDKDGRPHQAEQGGASSRQDNGSIRVEDVKRPT